MTNGENNMTKTHKAAKMIRCSRCKGTGVHAQSAGVVYAGMAGGCFKCARKGVVPNAAQKRLDEVVYCASAVTEFKAELAQCASLNADSLAEAAARGKNVTKRAARFAAREAQIASTVALWEGKLEVAQAAVV